MVSNNPSHGILSLNDVQMEKVLICFLREVFSGDLKFINQTGWDNFEVLRVSANARLRWGIDICIQMLQAANLNLKNRQLRKPSRERSSPRHTIDISAVCAG
jgi:hypothetical protein